MPILDDNDKKYLVKSATKWFFDQGVPTIILLGLLCVFTYIGLRYTPPFVKAVLQISSELKDLNSTLIKIKGSEDILIKKSQEILVILQDNKKVLEENNSLAKENNYLIKRNITN